MPKVHVAVEVQLAACISPRHIPETMKVDLNRLNMPDIYDTNRIKVGCSCVHIICLP